MYPTDVAAVDPVDALPVDPVADPLVPPLTPPAPVDPLQLPPLTDEQKAAVKQWLAACEDDQRRYADLWKRNLDAYAPPPEDLAKERDTYEVNTNVDFRQAEQKKAQLWFDTAQVQLTPIEPISEMVLQQMPPSPPPPGQQAQGSPGQQAPAAPGAPAGPGPQGGPPQPEQRLSTAITLHQTILNGLLGVDGLNARRTIQSAVLDCLVPAGWGVTYIGYTSFTRTVETPDPMTGIPMTVKVPVYEEYFWSRLSPSLLIVPADFKSTDFDKAPYIGRRFKEPMSVLRREYGAAIPEDFTGSVTPENTPMRENDAERNQPSKTAYDPYCTGQHLYYYEPTLNPDAQHPKRICEIVLLDGLENEVRHRYCPYQSVDAEGRLTGDSMIGYPIHVLTLREVPDDNHVPSDSSMTRDLTDELNQFRSQVLKSRDASIPYAFYDEDILPPEKIERITNGKYGPMIPVEGGRLNAANPPVMPGMKPQLSRETYAGQDVIERDLERTLAIGSNQTGATTQTRRTATEIATMQSSVDTRMAGEQKAVVEFFVKGVRKLDALVQRYSDRPQVTQIVGDNGANLWVTWDKTMIAGRFAYTIKPDSQVHVDAASDRQQDLAFYNLTARDPFINRMELARRLASKWGFNPDKLVAPPPPKGPPEPNVQVRVTASDLDPRLPQFPFVIEIIQQAGYTISPEALQNAVLLAGKATAIGSLPDDITPPKDTVAPVDRVHPGPAEQTEPISKHQTERTGRLPGQGSPFAPKP
jgi:hypothetical protein